MNKADILTAALLIVNVVFMTVALCNDDMHRLVFNGCIAIVCAVLFTYGGKGKGNGRVHY